MFLPHTNNPARSSDQTYRRAFTLLELCVAIVTAFILICLAGGFLVRSGHHRAYSYCGNNLKQLSLSFLIWSGDNSDRLPMQVSTNQGGSKEFINPNEVFRHFQTLSNELNTPIVLVCSEERARRPSTNFLEDFNNSHISYFLNLDADEKLPSALLSGDRFITNDLPLKNGTMVLVTNQSVRWTKGIHQMRPLPKYLGVFPRHAWGNLAVRLDHTVARLDSADLAKFLAESGVATNRLLVP